MIAHDAFDHHEPEAVAVGFGGEERGKEMRSVLLPDAGSLIDHIDIDRMFVLRAGNGERPPLRHGLDRVFDQVVKRLLKQVDVAADLRQIVVPQTIYGDIFPLDLMTHEIERFQHGALDVHGMEHRFGRPQGMQELMDDIVQPFDFIFRLGHHFLAVGGIETAAFEAFLEQLEVQIEAVQRIADLMGDFGGERGDQLGAFVFSF